LTLPLKIIQIGSSIVEHSGQTRDISSSGVLFESAAGMRPGERIEYLITLGNSPEVRIRCLGKVLRSDKCTDVEDRFEVAASIDRYQFVRVATMEAVSRSG
jgi:hypothetical protein